MDVSVVLAQATDAPAGGGIGAFLPLLLIFAVFYLLLIRPQQKRAKAQRELQQSIGAGDRVITVGGIHGTVEGVDEGTIRVEVAPGTVVTMAKGAVASRVVDADEPGGATGA